MLKDRKKSRVENSNSKTEGLLWTGNCHICSKRKHKCTMCRENVVGRGEILNNTFRSTKLKTGIRMLAEYKIWKVDDMKIYTRQSQTPK